MPALQPYVYEANDTEYFRVTVEDDLEEKRLKGKKSVYFTDQKVEFEVTTENLASNTTLKININIGVFFQHDQDVLKQFVIDETLDPDDSATQTFDVGLLPYQETGHVGVSKAIRSTPKEVGENKMEITRLGGSTKLWETVHTFSVFDRDFYKVNYLFPRWAQYIAAFLAVGIITVGVLQLLS